MKTFKRLKKSSLTALLLGIILLLNLTGCGGGKENSNSNNGANEAEFVYVADFLELQGIGSVVNLKEIDGVLHIISAEYGETTVYKLVTYDLENQATTETTLDSKAEGYFSSIFMNDDGSIEVIERKDEYDDEWNLLSSETYFNQYAADGTMTSSEPVAEKLQFEDDFYISHFMRVEEGNYLIGSWDSPLMVYNSDLVKIGEISSNNTQIDGLCVTGSGKVVGSWWGNSGVSIAVVDVAGKTVGTAIETGKNSGSATVWPGTGDTVLYMNGTELWSCDVVSGEAALVMNTMDMDINGEYLQTVYPLEDGSFLMSYNDYSSPSSEGQIILAKPVDPSTIKERIELTIATVGGSQNLNEAVITFNQNNEEYRIKVVDYITEDYDWETSLTNLQNDIVAGNVPDMIDASSSNMPWRNWAAKGIITDLYPLMEADGEFAKEELLENVRKAYEVDGSLYILPSTVMVNGVMVKEKYAEGITTLTPGVLLEMQSKLPADTKLFYYNYQGEVMYNMVYNNMSAYVDYEIGECYFNTDEFKSVLAYAKEQPAEMVWDESISLPAMLAEDKVIFHNFGMSQMPDYQFHKYVFGEDVAMLGYAGEDEDGIRIMTNGSALSITEQCEYKDVAWDFLKTFVSEEAQTKEHLWGIPVTQTGLDDFIYDAQHMDGSHSYGWDDVDLEITSATDEEVEEFLAILEKADAVSYQDTAITAIIEEEVKPYFEGQKSVDEVADIIQSRIDIYLKENM